MTMFENIYKTKLGSIICMFLGNLVKTLFVINVIQAS